ncbi:MAG: hypothetical protein ACRCY4_06920, partial [Brevinema sp.]
MSFSDIFNAYSSKVSAEGRADAISSQPDIPGNVLYALSNALEENRPNVIADPDDDSVIGAEAENDTNVSSQEDLGSDLSAEDRDRLLDSFSSLDDEPELEAPQPIENIPSPEIPEDLPIDLPEEPEVSEDLEELEVSEDLEELEEAPKAFSAFDSLPDDFVLDDPIDDAPIEETVLEQNTEAELSLDDELGLDLLSESDEAGSSNNDDDWDMPFDLGSEVEAPEFAPANDMMDFEIESPEDLNTESTESPAEEFEIPDFSNTNLETTEEDNAPLPEPIDIPEELPPAPSAAPDFDLFTSSEPIEDIDSAFNLSEEQVFLVREKINSIRNKQLRFEIRNIMIDPKSYGDLYDNLLSLILVDAPEEKIEALLAGFSQANDNEAIMPSVLTKSARATFLADDVENYEH